MTGQKAAPTRRGTSPWAGRAAGWVRGSRAELLVIGALVGIGSGLGAVVFRYLIYLFTWLATGHVAFGQDGHAGSSHLPWLGLAFFVVIPVIGGLIYGPLIYRYAREARGHGVPEVMIAVAQSGGRIRPQVSVVKAVASALCIGTGGSVGREGPIVQIGSALASSVGQWAKMPENRMRILVACGAGGGIAVPPPGAPSATSQPPMRCAPSGHRSPCPADLKARPAARRATAGSPPAARRRCRARSSTRVTGLLVPAASQAQPRTCRQKKIGEVPTDDERH